MGADGSPAGSFVSDGASTGCSACVMKRWVPFSPPPNASRRPMSVAAPARSSADTRWLERVDVAGLAVALAESEAVVLELTQRVRDLECERARLESRLRSAEKLEAIGQLASGIAHEINTPTQYIGDNLHFLEDSFARFA